MREGKGKMFKAVLLLCVLGLHPSECTEKTAMDVLIGPNCQNEISCGMLSQAYLASSQLGASMSGHYYLKIRITRTVTPTAQASD